MRNAAALIVTLFASLLIAGAVNQQVPEALLRGDAPVLDIAVEVYPVADDRIQLLQRPTPEKYKATVHVMSVAERRTLLGMKHLILAVGETGDASSEIGSLNLRFTATIDELSGHAKTSVVVTRDGELIAKQSSNISLMQPKGAIVPAQ